MGTKQGGKLGLWIKEHGIQPEGHKCLECCWFVENCLKWSEEKNPFDKSCHYFQRKSNKSIPYKINQNAREEYAYILDFLPYGRSDDKRPMYKKKPIVLGVGEKNFIFFEMMPKKDILPKIDDRVYIGDGDRQVIDHIKRRISYQELNAGARKELKGIIDKLIMANEKKYVRFFNESTWITMKLHELGLLAHINNSKQGRIIKEKEKKPFDSFTDIEMRTSISPSLAISNRILCELNNPVKYLLFVDKEEITLKPKGD